MKKTTSPEQDYYMMVKATFDTLEAEIRRVEDEYTLQLEIVNPDGTVAGTLMGIDDEDEFDKVSAATAAIIEKSGLWEKRIKAREALKIAEDELIQYGLSIAPAGVAKTLHNAARSNYTTRQKLIDLIITLDASAVK